MMRDETLIEPFSVQEIFVDGFAGHKIREGNMFCAGFRFQEPSRQNGDHLKIVQIKLVFPVASINTSREFANMAMRLHPGADVRDVAVRINH